MIERTPNAQPFPKLSIRDAPRVLGQLVRRMARDLAVMALLCCLAVLIRLEPSSSYLVLMESSSLNTLGIAVSVFVAFRNTQAINRWWESRILWGGIVNLSRHWRDSLNTLLLSHAEGQAEQQRMLNLQVLLCWLLNYELRGYRRRDAAEATGRLCHELGLQPDLSLQQGLRHRASEVRRLYESGLINNWGRESLLKSSETFLNALGGLQRIRNSPIPPTYDVFIRLICWFYGFAQFLNFTNRGDVWEGLILFIGFVTAERVGAYVENPFDLDGSCFCIPMDSICRTISTDLMEAQAPLASLPISNDPSRWT